MLATGGAWLPIATHDLVTLGSQAINTAVNKEATMENAKAETTELEQYEVSAQPEVNASENEFVLVEEEQFVPALLQET
jgi:hypothetical protein